MLTLYLAFHYSRIGHYLKSHLSYTEGIGVAFFATVKDVPLFIVLVISTHTAFRSGRAGLTPLTDTDVYWNSCILELMTCSHTLSATALIVAQLHGRASPLAHRRHWSCIFRNWSRFSLSTLKLKNFCTRKKFFSFISLTSYRVFKCQCYSFLFFLWYFFLDLLIWDNQSHSQLKLKKENMDVDKLLTMTPIKVLNEEIVGDFKMVDNVDSQHFSPMSI